MSAARRREMLPDLLRAAREIVPDRSGIRIARENADGDPDRLRKLY